jgi:hypothetical protein
MFADTSQDAATRTVPIFIDDDFRGSGTLARIGAYHGIITAEHVVNHPDNPDLRIYGPNARGRILQTGLGAGRIAKTTFKADHLRFVTARGETDKDPAKLGEGKGPDLAFIVLPMGDPYISHIESGRTFTSFDKDFEARRMDALKGTETLLFAGYPHQLAGRKIERRGNLNLIDYHVVTCNAKVGQTFFEDQWDYCDIDVDLEKIPQLDGDRDKVFGGVSGGGSWRQILEKDGARCSRLSLASGLCWSRIPRNSQGQHMHRSSAWTHVDLPAFDSGRASGAWFRGCILIPTRARHVTGIIFRPDFPPPHSGPTTR